MIHHFPIKNYGYASEDEGWWWEEDTEIVLTQLVLRTRVKKKGGEGEGFVDVVSWQRYHSC